MPARLVGFGRHAGVDVTRQCDLFVYNVDRGDAHYNASCQVARNCVLKFGLMWTGI